MARLFQRYGRSVDRPPSAQSIDKYLVDAKLIEENGKPTKAGTYLIARALDAVEHVTDPKFIVLKTELEGDPRFKKDYSEAQAHAKAILSSDEAVMILRVIPVARLSIQIQEEKL